MSNVMVECQRCRRLVDMNKTKAIAENGNWYQVCEECKVDHTRQRARVGRFMERIVGPARNRVSKPR